MLYDVATIINIVIVIMIRYRYGAGTYRLEMGPVVVVRGGRFCIVTS